MATRAAMPRTSEPTVRRMPGLLPPAYYAAATRDRKSTRLNSSHANISYAVFCLKKKKRNILDITVNAVLLEAYGEHNTAISNVSTDEYDIVFAEGYKGAIYDKIGNAHVCTLVTT